MIGGGEGAFIGPVHRIAAAIAGNCRLVAGALSSDPEQGAAVGRGDRAGAGRSYASFEALLAGERALPDGRARRVRRHRHAQSCPCARRHRGAGGGLPGADRQAARPTRSRPRSPSRRRRAHRRTGRRHPHLYRLSDGPAGARARRRRASSARCGGSRCSYTQGWLRARPRTRVGKQAEWRIDPARSGLAGAFGDIGTHAFNLVEFITGERMTRLSAELRAAVPGRRLDDDGAAMFHLSGGGRGTLVASQICTGDANGLAISVWCEEAGLHWRAGASQSSARRAARQARGDLDPRRRPRLLSAMRRWRVDAPALRPSRGLSRSLRQHLPRLRRGGARQRARRSPCYASLADGVAGMRFIQAAHDSSARGARLDRPRRRRDDEGTRHLPGPVRRRRGAVQQPAGDGEMGGGSRLYRRADPDLGRAAVRPRARRRKPGLLRRDRRHLRRGGRRDHRAFDPPPGPARRRPPGL